MSEQQRIIALLKQQLEDRDKVRGKPKWSRLTNEYNRGLHQKIQYKGSRLVQEGVKKTPVTDYDRFAPWRTKGAIQNIIKKKGTWEHLIQPILNEAEQRRNTYDARRPANVDKSPKSPDEKELPNPDAPKTKAEIKITNEARRDERRREAELRRQRKNVVDLESDEDEDEDDDMEEDDY